MSAIATRTGNRRVRRALGRGLLALTRVRLRTWGILAGVLALLVGFGLWFRDSTFVDVRTVHITGVEGPQAAQIRSALRTAALDQTTLHVNKAAIRDAVSTYQLVTRVDVSAHFPHSMTIRVHENVPVAAVAADGVRAAVTADGELLHSAPNLSSLPVVPVAAPPSSGYVSVSGVLQALHVIGGAPPALAARATRVTWSAEHGVVVQFRHGPVAWFGGDEAVADKWAALASVLADSAVAGASYVDVTVPRQPAVGGVSSTPRQSNTPQIDTTTSPTTTP